MCGWDINIECKDSEVKEINRLKRIRCAQKQNLTNYQELAQKGQFSHDPINKAFQDKFAEFYK